MGRYLWAKIENNPEYVVLSIYIYVVIVDLEMPKK